MKRIFLPQTHPNCSPRKPDLNPDQSGLLRLTKDYLRKQVSGKKFENEVSLHLKESFKEDVLFDNMYFETGKYSNKLKIYQTIQIDHILVSKEGVFCIEDKYLSNDIYREVSGGAQAKSWKTKRYPGKRGSANEINGLKQNYYHFSFLKELFEYNEMNVPIFQMTILGGIDRSKIKVQSFIDANLVDTTEYVDRIKYIKKRNHIGIDVNSVCTVLKQWECTTKGREKLHIAYIRNINKKALPKKCKCELRQLRLND